MPLTTPGGPDDLIAFPAVMMHLRLTGVSPTIGEWTVRRFMLERGFKLSPRKLVVKRSVLEDWLSGRLPLPAPGKAQQGA